MKTKREFSRGKKARLNVVSSFASQFVTLACGLVIPRLMLSNYGSVAYGATQSITQFLSYISLLDGGVSGVARAALYKPLAQKNSQVISNIVYQIQRFFKIVAAIFVVYVLILALFFNDISHSSEFDRFFTFGLVIAISISIFAQYFIGISYQILIQAAQKSYVINVVNIITVIINTFLTIILVLGGCNLIIVKLVSSFVFVLRPLVYCIYIRKKYSLPKADKDFPDALTQKWSGLGQHIAFFLHSNTDTAVLTIFSDLGKVAVYSVYNMVIYNIQNFTTSFSNGMEALFGDMIAKKESSSLDKAFDLYDTLISIISIVLFSTTALYIVPFIKIYTRGLNDANYIAPTFSLILSLASMTHCLRLPYHELTIAAGRFKQTQIAAYSEAFINITSSIILVLRFGIVGVAIGTLLAISFRFLYYAFYLSKHIIHRNIFLTFKREAVNYTSFFLIYFIGSLFIKNISFDNYVIWAIHAAVSAILILFITLLINYIFYREAFINAFNHIKHRHQVKL